MSKVDTVFRSVEHLVNILYVRRFGASTEPEDLTATIAALIQEYKDDPMMIIALSLIQKFRNKWAHSTYRECKDMGIAMDVLGRELEVEKNKTMSLFADMVKLSIFDLNDEYNKKVQDM
jgi:hypothetical protein